MLMQTQVFLFLGVVAVWLFLMSIVLHRVFALFKNLSKGIEEDLSKKGFAEVRQRIALLEESSKHHIQKVALVKFNPFKELGGDHSFSLAILDGDNTGIIVTSLHTRDRTRIYVKEIKKGKSSYELSIEEKKALTSAQGIK